MIYNVLWGHDCDDTVTNAKDRAAHPAIVCYKVEAGSVTEAAQFAAGLVEAALADVYCREGSSNVHIVFAD